MSLKLFLGTALMSLLLCACTETRFATLPGEDLQSCDRRWEGVWQEVGADGRRTDVPRHLTGFVMDAECRLRLFEEPEEGGALQFFALPLRFLHLRGSDYLVVSDRDLHELVELEPPFDVDPAPVESFFFLRYRLRGDRLELNQVDSEQTARWVLDGTLDGSLTKGRHSLHVYVRGDAKQMRELLSRRQLFSRRGDWVMRRSHLSLEDFERARLEQHPAGR